MMSSTSPTSSLVPLLPFYDTQSLLVIQTRSEFNRGGMGTLNSWLGHYAARRPLIPRPSAEDFERRSPLGVPRSCQIVVSGTISCL